MAETIATPMLDALFASIETGDLEAVQRILAESGGVNAKDRHGNTPLIRAAALGNDRMVTLLIKAGAHVNARNGEGQTALIAAADYSRHPGNLQMEGYETIIERLLEAGADPAIRDHAGRNAYDLARPSIKMKIESYLKSRMETQPAMTMPETP